MANNANDVVLTADGKAKLEEELRYLETDKRDEVGERIRIAREFGDISENSEYDDAKNEQAILEQRIAEINDVLANAQVVDTPKKGNRVGGAEADSAQGKISNESPVGAAVLGHKKGDVIEYEGPTGRKMKFTLTKVGH